MNDNRIIFFYRICSHSRSGILYLFPRGTGLLKKTKKQKKQRGAVDTEIKVPSFENTELKRSPFSEKAESCENLWNELVS